MHEQNSIHVVVGDLSFSTNRHAKYRDRLALGSASYEAQRNKHLWF